MKNISVSPLAGACILLLSSVVGWIAVQTTGLDQYMDEIFHVPQTQLYCQGKFDEWDDKITTFPGLYLLASLVSAIAAPLLPLQELCSVPFLRLVNLTLAGLIPMMAALCRRQLFRKRCEDAVEAALVLSVYPFIMFYYFMYYTDTLSTMCLITAYYISFYADSAAEPDRSAIAYLCSHLAILATASFTILVRQTNTVWILFMAGTLMLRRLEAIGAFKDSELSILQFCSFLRALLTHPMCLLSAAWSLLLPVFAFIVFVVVNGSIVVGDKEHHEAVIHLSMPWHMFACAALVLGPVELLQPLAAVVRRNESKGSTFQYFWSAMGAISAISIVAYCLLYSCLDHEFLLSDNRHYTFYIWRYFLSRYQVRAALVLPYVYCLWIIVRKLLATHGPVWVLIFFIAVVTTLVPARLFEFRYFTPGVVIAYLNFPPVKPLSSANDCATSLVRRYAWLITFALNLLISAALLVIFIHKPFSWGDGSVARFMP